jgi:hypothetical protein
MQKTPTQILLLTIAACCATALADEVDYTKTTPQNVFATPILNPMAEHAYGEPAIAWHDGEYFLVYDHIGVEGGPAGLMTSTDGVYWREEGSVLLPNPGEGCVACLDIRRFKANGPFVMNYDAKVEGEWVTRFATSHDLRRWEKLDVILKRDPALYRRASYVHYSIPSEDGNGFYAIGAYTPTEYVGTGLLRSDDGIHWENLPGPRVEGVIDQKGGLDAGPGWKALEASAVLKLADRYFVLGGNPHTDSDIVVAAEKIDGPYRPTPKNHILPRGPQIFHRVYELPDGWLSMPMIWAEDERRYQVWAEDERRDQGSGAATEASRLLGKRYYYIAPFRRVITDGQSLWFRWWEGNDRLKVHSLPVSVCKAAGNNPSLRMLDRSFDLSEGLVLETSVPLGSDHSSKRNLALDAVESAENIFCKSWWPENYYAAEKAVDDRETTAWRGHGMKEKETVDFCLDLQQEREIGRIAVKWFPAPKQVRILYSRDGQAWQTLYTGKAKRKWENVDIQARYLRLEMTPYPRRNRGKELLPISDHIVGISEIGVYADPRETLPPTGSGLVLETEDGNGYAWLVEKHGRIRFGRLTDGLSRFHTEKVRDLEVDFGDRADIRVIQRDDLVDLYVNDYQVDYYHLKGKLGGQFGLLGAENVAGSKIKVKAWRPDPSVQRSN